MADDGYGGAPIVQAAGSSDPYGGAPVVQPSSATGWTAPFRNFVADWQTRAAEGNAGLHAYVDQAQKPTLTDQALHGMGVPTLNDIKGGMSALTVAGAPFMAAWTAMTGRPVAAVANAANNATGLMPGYEADPNKIGDVTSIVAPLGEAALSERAIQAGAKAAGITESQYARAAEAGRQAAAAAQARQAAEAARATAAAKAAKPGIVAPFAAAVSPDAASAQAGAKLAAAADDPAAAQASLAAGPAELVPGSAPTTFQQTGDMGIGSLERQARTADPGAYQARAAEQNAARQEALPNPAANPGDIGATLRAHLDAADAANEADVTAAAARAGAARDTLGAETTPEESGGAIRTAISDAEKAGRAKTSAMYTELGLDDPAVTANVGATKGAAGDILGGQAATARPPEGEEAAIFSAASSMKPVSPMRDLLELRSRVAAELRRQRAPTGDPQAVRRLSRLQGAIDGNLDTSIADQVEAGNAATQTGEVQAGNSLATRLSSALDELGQQQPEARAIGGGPVEQPGAGPSVAPVGADGTAIPPSGGPGGIAGNPSVPGEQPTVSPDVIPALRAANAEYKAQRQTFGADPIDNVLAQDKAGGFAVLNGEVPKNVFRPGPGGFERAQNAIAAGGDRAQQAIEDYAAQSLRRAAVRPDGTIDAAAHARWMKAHQDALRALPEATRARLTEVGDAQRALDEASANRDAATKAANADKLAQRLSLADPAEIAKIVGSIFNKADAVTQLRGLIAKLKGDPEALAGLRQAVADHITTNYVGNTEAATSGVNQIKADAFQSFVRKNSGALRLVLSPEELSNLHAIAADITRAKRSENALRLAGGSNTAQDSHGLTKAEEAAKAKQSKSMLDLIGAAFGGLIGAHAGPYGAAGGAGVGLYAGQWLQATLDTMRARGIGNVEALVNKALLDPQLARALLAKAPVHRAGTTALETGMVVRSKAIQRALAASALANETQDNRQ